MTKQEIMEMFEMDSKNEQMKKVLRYGIIIKDLEMKDHRGFWRIRMIRLNDTSIVILTMLNGEVFELTEIVN